MEDQENLADTLKDSNTKIIDLVKVAQALANGRAFELIKTENTFSLRFFDVNARVIVNYITREIYAVNEKNYSFADSLSDAYESNFREPFDVRKA